MATLLYDAHIDEVGVIVTEYTDGFCKIAAVGNPDIRTMPAGEVMFIADGADGLADCVYGVVSALPPHLIAGQDTKIIKADDLFVDTGGVPVRAGTFGVMLSGIIETSDESGGHAMISGKALDNRASAAILIDVMKRLEKESLDIDLKFLFSTQEELGMRGASVGAYNSGADYAVIVDVTFGRSADTTGHESFELGSGVTVAVGANMNRKFTERIKTIAGRHGIPYQIEVLPGNSGTNAAVIQLANGGIAAAVVSVPLRYMHSAVETLDARDLQAASDLLYWIAKEF